MQIILSGLALGFLGSFHCIGMCGPIALAIPIGKYSQFQKFIAILLYNFGRVITYSCIGLLIGLFGRSLAIAGIQNYLSISIGILILIFVIVFKFEHKIKFISNSKFQKSIKNKISYYFKNVNLFSIFSIGILNGLLPCGFVYIASASALIFANTKDSTVFMASFGFGTLPVMLSLYFVQNYISIKFRNQIKKLAPILISFVAILMIIRGMNLGIQYISPKTDIQENKIENCCKP